MSSLCEESARKSQNRMYARQSGLRLSVVFRINREPLKKLAIWLEVYLEPCGSADSTEVKIIRHII